MDGGDPDLRQCLLCMPQDPAIVPGHLYFKPDIEALMIATQTCSLCGPGAEPSFEVAVVELLNEFDREHEEARGKLTRFIRLEVVGSESIRGVRLDASRRAILPSSDILTLTARAERVSAFGEKTFRGWIARYYSRIAWPETLGKRLGKRKLRKTMQSALNETLIEGTSPYKIRDDVYAIYMHWSPEHEELAEGANYTVVLLIICGKKQTQDRLVQRLSGMASGVKDAPVMNGVVMDDPNVILASEANYHHTRNMHVYTAFDDLT